MSAFSWHVMSGTINAIAKPGVMISVAIAEAKKLSNQHHGLPVKFDLNGVPMMIHGDTSETSAYWNYMRSLDEAVS